MKIYVLNSMNVKHCKTNEMKEEKNMWSKVKAHCSQIPHVNWVSYHLIINFY